MTTNQHFLNTFGASLCVGCEDKLTSSEMDFLSSWYLASHSEERVSFEILCADCFDLKFPGYLKSDLWVEDIREWTRMGFDSEAAIAWQKVGFSPYSATIWSDVLLQSNRFADPSIAKSWVAAGFNHEDYEECQGWGVGAKELAEILKTSVVSAKNFSIPSAEFRKFGFNLSDAVRLSEAEFHTDREFSDLHFIGNWTLTGLDVAGLVALKLEIVSKEERFDEKHDNCQKFIKNWEPDFASGLPKAFKSFRELGIQISVENLLNYWGLSKAQILKAIDMGIDTGLAGDLVRNGIPVTKAKIVDHLKSIGVEVDQAISFVSRGFSLHTLVKISKLSYSIQEYAVVFRALINLQADEVLSWLEVDVGSSTHTWLHQISRWHQSGFTPESAAVWYKEEFGVQNADLWVRSGVKTPRVAKLRKAAGISPKPK